ncbi:hypothetical protein ATC03_07940 [Agromyces aureus]|uniref:Uncharacterized protein n=1 Tax=Agromyces aureus TaxID=453304 RepID=A0A191WEF4_9MICO|nr:hypothetical protein ATC03_07940 [Agromyces aureus]
MSAEIGLHDLTPALAGFYSVGFNDGQESMAAERDRLYERLYYGKELPDVRLRRMRAGAAAYWEEFVHERVRDIIEDRGRA